VPAQAFPDWHASLGRRCRWRRASRATSGCCAIATR